METEEEKEVQSGGKGGGREREMGEELTSRVLKKAQRNDCYGVNIDRRSMT